MMLHMAEMLNTTGSPAQLVPVLYNLPHNPIPFPEQPDAGSLPADSLKPGHLKKYVELQPGHLHCELNTLNRIII